jgi:tetratricopeptide (TPR) repeat protein
MRAYAYLLVILFFIGCSDDDQSRVGDRYYKNGEYKKAITAYNEYLKLKPSDEITIYNRGRAYEELKQYDKALEDFKKVLKINPKDEGALLSYGNHYYRQEDYENAAYQFEQAFKNHKNSERAAFMLARSLHKLGEVEKAMEHYNNAININKNYGEAYMYRGALNIYLKKKSQGCSDLRTAKSLDVAQAQDLLDTYCK